MKHLELRLILSSPHFIGGKWSGSEALVQPEREEEVRSSAETADRVGVGLPRHHAHLTRLNPPVAWDRVKEHTYTHTHHTHARTHTHRERERGGG